MCGIFGFFSARRDRSVNLELLERAALGVESRGPHAWGVAIIREGRLSYFKQPGRISDYLGNLARACDGAQAVIGHCRWATHGSPSDNSTNHPHPCDGGWLIHNGQIEEAGAYQRDMDLHPVTDCDSELLAQFAERSTRRYGWQRIAEAVAYAQAYARYRPAHAVAYLNRTGLTLVRAGKPLYGSSTRAGVYWSTTGTDLPGAKPRPVPDCHAMTFRHSGDVMKVALHAIETSRVEDGNVTY